MSDLMVVTPKFDDINRFMEKILVDSQTDCWRWQGGMDQNGYTQFWLGKRVVGANRYAYVLFGGKLKEGQSLKRVKKCPHQNCVNPAHMRPETVAAAKIG